MTRAVNSDFIVLSQETPFSFQEKAKMVLITPLYLIAYSFESIAVTCLRVVKFIINTLPGLNPTNLSENIESLIESMELKIAQLSPWAEPIKEAESKEPPPIETPLPTTPSRSYLSIAKTVLPPILAVAIVLFIVYRRTNSLPELPIEKSEILNNTKQIFRPESINQTVLKSFSPKDIPSNADSSSEILNNIKQIFQPEPIKETVLKSFSPKDIPCSADSGKALILSQRISTPMSRIVKVLNPIPRLGEIAKCISGFGEAEFLDEAKGVFQCVNPSINWDHQAEALESIGTTFRTHASLFHPDKGGDQKMFSIIKNAYVSLKEAFHTEKEYREMALLNCIQGVGKKKVWDLLKPYYLYKCLGIPFNLSNNNLEININCGSLRHSINKALESFEISNKEIINQYIFTYREGCRSKDDSNLRLRISW